MVKRDCREFRMCDNWMLLEGGESRNFQGPGFFQVLEIFRSPGKIQVGMCIFPMIMPSASSSVEIGTFARGSILFIME